MRAALSSLPNEAYDVAVIGGGVNGTSTAFELARMGYRVALLEKDDFAAGASARSSRLVQNGAWALATSDGFWGSLRRPLTLWGRLIAARKYLSTHAEKQRTHPQHLHHFEYLLPDGDTNPYKVWQMAMGLRAVNVVSLGRGRIKFHGVKDPSQYSLYRYHRAGRPTLGALAMDDIMVDAPERFAVELALEAEAYGATVANHAKVVALQRAGSMWTIGVEDTLYGDTAELTAAVVINTAGAWGNGVDALASTKGPRRIAPTKGAHLMVKLPEYQEGIALLTMTGNGKEPYFATPFRGLYHFGNTHTEYTDDLDHVEVTPDDYDYLMTEGRRAFPGANLDDSMVAYTYSGVRPLTADDVTWTFNAVVHDREAQDGTPNMITLSGAPMATFSAVGRKLSALTAKKLAAAGRTPATVARRPFVADPRVESVPATPICEHDRRTLRDAARGLLVEHGETLADVLRRRTTSVWNECMALHCAEHVARTLAPLAGWDDARVADEVAAYTKQVVTTFHPRAAART